jgi:hypothetical protein
MVIDLSFEGFRRGVFQFELLIRNEYEHIGGYGNPYMGLDSVFTLTPEGLYLQMLLDPFEESFNSPA